MKSIISNKKRLNSNNYKNIVITQEVSDDIKINVTGKIIDYPMEMTGVPFTKTIISQEQSVITEEVIEYFKRNTTLHYVKQDKVKGHSGTYIIFGNYFNERSLALKLDQDYKKCLNSMIIKYLDDRLKFLEQNEDVRLIKIWGTFKESDYYICEDAEANFNSVNTHDRIGEKKQCLYLNLLEKVPNKLVKYEQDFIAKFLYEKIMSAPEDEEFALSYSSPYIKFGRIKIKSNNICIELPGCFYRSVESLLMQREHYLKELAENQMKLNLEMERKK